MAENLFEKFNSMIDVAGLKEDVKAAEANTGDFVDVPHGDYEVKLASLELGAAGEKSKTPGMPMAKARFSVVAGEYKGNSIFMNQMLTSGFGIHKMNEILIALETGIDVQFEDYAQYANLLKAVYEAASGSEYQLSYGENAKGFSTYTIVQKFN